MRFVIERGNEDIIPSSGLAIVGLLLSKTTLKTQLNSMKVPSSPDPLISHYDVVSSYIGLLCQGESDFESIEKYRREPFFRQSLLIKQVPSSSRLRQRLDGMGELGTVNKMMLKKSGELLKVCGVAITPCHGKHLALDIDVSPFDNSFTKKEGVSLTYKGHEGYSPIFAYLGEEGYCMNVELRQGKDHSQNGTPEFLKETISLTRSVTNEPLLVRMDSGFDSADNIDVLLKNDLDFIIKRNLRRESKEYWLSYAQENGSHSLERDGKNVYTGSLKTTKIVEDKKYTINIIYKVVERKIKSNGQILLLPEIEVDTYWTTLSVDATKIIRLYQDHGTSEQFHSEIKTELDVERLPSGRFATNSLVLHLAVFAYNILRLIGQESLKESDAPIRKKVQRRRIRTVIKNLIALAARMVRHARRIILRFGRHSPWLSTFNRIYSSLASS